ncbi:MAG: sterol desaturase family protein [Pseudomonadota bacterium]
MDLLDQIFSLFSDFINPKKRVFVGYLFLSFLLGFAWLVFFRGSNLRSAVQRLFDRKIWFSDSAQADYKIFLINRIFTGFISPLLLTQVAIATAIYMALVRSDLDLWGVYEGAPATLVIALFSTAMFVADDFTKYLMHRWMHKWPALWAIHKVHHSAETMTPMTVYRVHPLEGVLYATRSVMAQGPTISIFYYFFGEGVNLYTVLGVNVLVFIFHVTGSNLRHSHVDIRYPKWMEHLLISPAQHQLHHSIAEAHYDKNYGAALAIWDWLFGSLHLSEGQHDMEFGLRASEAHSATSLRVMYLRPFAEIYRAGQNTAKRVGVFLVRSMRYVRSPLGDTHSSTHKVD